MTSLNLADTASALSIVMTVGGLFYYTATLKAQIRTLSEVIQSLSASVDASNADRRALDTRITGVEESAKSAHKRLDRVEGVVDRWSQK
jgi:outer membrane murein-binding lipoprotein Lpp